ncbi:MAG: hypothetical protein ABIH39_06795, partial [Candidatus Margulisiibacteriota bacterium]
MPIGSIIDSAKDLIWGNDTPKAPVVPKTGVNLPAKDRFLNENNMASAGELLQGKAAQDHIGKFMGDQAGESPILDRISLKNSIERYIRKANPNPQQGAPLIGEHAIVMSRGLKKHYQFAGYLPQVEGACEIFALLLIGFKYGDRVLQDNETVAPLLALKEAAIWHERLFCDLKPKTAYLEILKLNANHKWQTTSNDEKARLIRTVFFGEDRKVLLNGKLTSLADAVKTVANRTVLGDLLSLDLKYPLKRKIEGVSLNSSIDFNGNNTNPMGADFNFGFIEDRIENDKYNPEYKDGYSADDDFMSGSQKDITDHELLILDIIGDKFSIFKDELQRINILPNLQPQRSSFIDNMSSITKWQLDVVSELERIDKIEKNNILSLLKNGEKLLSDIEGSTAESSRTLKFHLSLQLAELYAGFNELARARVYFVKAQDYFKQIPNNKNIKAANDYLGYLDYLFKASELIAYGDDRHFESVVKNGLILLASIFDSKNVHAAVDACQNVTGQGVSSREFDIPNIRFAPGQFRLSRILNPSLENIFSLAGNRNATDLILNEANSSLIKEQELYGVPDRINKNLERKKQYLPAEDDDLRRSSVSTGMLNGHDDRVRDQRFTAPFWWVLISLKAAQVYDGDGRQSAAFYNKLKYALGNVKDPQDISSQFNSARIAAKDSKTGKIPAGAALDETGDFLTGDSFLYSLGCREKGIDAQRLEIDLMASDPHMLEWSYRDAKPLLFAYIDKYEHEISKVKKAKCEDGNDRSLKEYIIHWRQARANGVNLLHPSIWSIEDPENKMAMDRFQKVLKAKAVLSRIYMEEGNWSEARKLLEDVVCWKDLAINLAGQFFYIDVHLDLAKVYFKENIRTKGMLGARVVLGSIDQEYLNIYKTDIAKNRFAKSTQIRKAELYYEMGNYHAAIDSYYQVLGINDFNDIKNLNKQRDIVFNQDLSRKLYEKVKIGLANAFVQTGRFKEAEALFFNVLGINNNPLQFEKNSLSPDYNKALVLKKPHELLDNEAENIQNYIDALKGLGDIIKQRTMLCHFADMPAHYGKALEFYDKIETLKLETLTGNVDRPILNKILINARVEAGKQKADIYAKEGKITDAIDENNKTLRFLKVSADKDRVLKMVYGNTDNDAILSRFKGDLYLQLIQCYIDEGDYSNAEGAMGLLAKDSELKTKAGSMYTMFVRNYMVSTKLLFDIKQNRHDEAYIREQLEKLKKEIPDMKVFDKNEAPLALR